LEKEGIAEKELIDVKYEILDGNFKLVICEQGYDIKDELITAKEREIFNVYCVLARVMKKQM
jgi:hypothetical protein